MMLFLISKAQIVKSILVLLKNLRRLEESGQRGILFMPESKPAFEIQA
jgi:hypothetical protein